MLPLYRYHLEKARYSDLINGTRDQTEDVFLVTKDVRESVREGGHSLYGGEGHLPNVVAVSEPKYPLCLVHCHTLLHTKDVLVEGLALAAR